MKRTMFSIVVVCLNAGVKLEETVASIRSQTYEDYEIIIKDGLSSDGSLNCLKETERLRIISKKDRGIYDAMNQAVELVHGDIVYFLNCGDSFWDERVLERASGFITDWEKNHSSGTQAAIYYGDIIEKRTQCQVSSNPKINAFACYRNVPCHQACFYSAKLLRRKGFELKYRVRGDYEQFLWCFFCGKADTCYMPFTVALYEGGGFSETEENRRVSAKEHNEIVSLYMSRGRILLYQIYLAATLAPFRTWLASNKKTAGFYQALKACVYRFKR